MPNITMEDFIDECLTGKKKPKRKKIIEDKPVDIKKIFNEEDSVVDTKKATDKTDDDDVENKDPEKTNDEDEKEKDVVLKLILTIDDVEKVKSYTKETQIKAPIGWSSIMARFGYSSEVIAKLADNQITTTADTTEPTSSEPKELESEKSNELRNFRLEAKELITSGAGTGKVILSYTIDGEGPAAIQSAEIIIPPEISMKFEDSPTPLGSAIKAFNDYYYENILGKVRRELEESKK